jgi:hypothetical protein
MKSRICWVIKAVNLCYHNRGLNYSSFPTRTKLNNLCLFRTQRKRLNCKQEPFLWESHSYFLAFSTYSISMNKYMWFQYTTKLRHNIVYVFSVAMSKFGQLPNGYDISSTALNQSKLLKYFYYWIIIAPNSCNWNIHYTFQLLRCEAIIKPKLKYNAGPNEDFLVNNTILMGDKE